MRICLGDLRSIFRFWVCGLARKPRQLAKDGVYHTSSKRLSRLLSQFHALADGRVGRNAIQIQKLERAQTQSGLDYGCKPGIWPSQQGSNARVELHLPTQRAEHEGRRQRAILSR